MSSGVPTLVEDDPRRVGAELGEEVPDGQTQAPHADLQLRQRLPLGVPLINSPLSVGLKKSMKY